MSWQNVKKKLLMDNSFDQQQAIMPHKTKII